MSLVTAPTADLPPRTWRQWWRELPGYWRIGAWAVLGIFVVNAAFMLRIAIGLQEAAGITRLRALKHTQLEYAWDYEPDEWKRQLIAGFRGRSGSNLEMLIVTKPDGEDLKFIGNECRNLVELELWQPKCEGDDFLPLVNCVKLRTLRISHCDLDDRAMPIFRSMSQLRQLTLSNTLVSDKLLPVLRDLPSLETLDLGYTDLTAEAFQSWKQNPTKSRAFLHAEHAEFPNVLGVIRWSDGRRSAAFPGPFTFRLEPPWKLPDKQPLELSTDLDLDRMLMSWNPNQPSKFCDGEHRAFLTLRGYDSEPVVVSVKDGIPSTNRVEFCIPITKEEALRNLSPSERGVSAP